ncbi:hypothetical protein ACQEWB_48260 [Streptomyces sp. CA-249302]|uniref:hypothetical protein n=1 Tax=Streptomyces sp. CA-249302 TaxID=3240058 RepID=UPI003D915F3A
MARLYLRSGMDPGAPETAYAVLVVDPGGTPGERAVAALGSYCYEGDGALYLVRTDGWAEKSAVAGQLVVGIAVHPVALRQADVNPEEFPGRSSADPRAVLLLEVRAPVDPALTAHLAEPTAVFGAGPDTTVDELLASDDAWPMLLAPPPQN